MFHVNLQGTVTPPHTPPPSPFVPPRQKRNVPGVPCGSPTPRFGTVGWRCWTYTLMEPATSGKKNDKHFSKSLRVPALQYHNSWMPGCLFDEYFLHEWQLMPNRQIPSLRRLGLTCHRRSMINYIYPHGQLRSYLSSRHPLIATA